MSPHAHCPRSARRPPLRALAPRHPHRRYERRGARRQCRIHPAHRLRTRGNRGQDAAPAQVRPDAPRVLPHALANGALRAALAQRHPQPPQGRFALLGRRDHPADHARRGNGAGLFSAGHHRAAADARSAGRRTRPSGRFSAREPRRALRSSGHRHHSTPLRQRERQGPLGQPTGRTVFRSALVAGAYPPRGSRRGAAHARLPPLARRYPLAPLPSAPCRRPLCLGGRQGHPGTRRTRSAPVSQRSTPRRQPRSRAKGAARQARPPPARRHLHLQTYTGRSHVLPLRERRHAPHLRHRPGSGARRRHALLCLGAPRRPGGDEGNLRPFRGHARTLAAPLPARAPRRAHRLGRGRSHPRTPARRIHPVVRLHRRRHRARRGRAQAARAGSPLPHRAR